MSNKAAQKELLTTLREMKLTEYGEFIPADFVQEVLGIEMPATATRKEFAKLEIVEMAAIDYCRAHLINEGKYIKQVPNGYRVLLPSENVGQIESYMDSADRKLSRALRLSRTTPREAAQIPDQTEARILMKMQQRRG
jgi:hypothetical protein